jgi:plastocyanin
MKTKVSIVILIVLLIVSCRYDIEMATNEVVLSGQKFTPNSLRVPLGTTVSWVNNEATNYTVTSDSLFFDSGNMSKGNTFSYVFSKSGTFTYHSNNQNGMTGTIIVQSDTIQKVVSIFQFSFIPGTLTITKGTVVKWVNNDPVTHLVTSDNGIFESSSLNQGDSFTYTFQNAGSFPYHCHIHPSMTGTIVVL